MTARLGFLRRHPRMFLSGIQENILKTWIPAFAGMTALMLTNILPVSASSSQVGTSGAQFLKIGASARPTAMGDAFTGVADDINAIYYNPAGLATLERPEITAMHTQWFQGLNYDFGAFVYPGSFGAFGVSAATLKTDDIQKRGVDESYQGTTESLDGAYTLSYARNFDSTLSWGVSGRFIHEKIDTASADAWLGDVGVLKKFHHAPLSLGMAIRNMGQKIKFLDESDPPPTVVDVGFGSHLMNRKLTLGLDIKFPRDNDLQYCMGTEWKQNISKDIRYALRAGFNSASTDAQGANGIAFGAGMGFQQLELDFAWVPLGDLGNTFRYSASFKF